MQTSGQSQELPVLTRTRQDLSDMVLNDKILLNDSAGVLGKNYILLLEWFSIFNSHNLLDSMGFKHLRQVALIF